MSRFIDHEVTLSVHAARFEWAIQQVQEAIERVIEPVMREAAESFRALGHELAVLADEDWRRDWYCHPEDAWWERA